MRASASLSSFYFFYFASLAVFIPFWNPYLEQELGFSNIAIGVMTAVVLGTRTIAPLLWGWLVDHMGHRVRVIQLTSLVVPLIAVSAFWIETPLTMALMLVAFSFFWNAGLPQVEAAAFDSLGNAREGNYAFLRIWGSVGFIVCVTAVGFLVDAHGIVSILPVMIALLIMIWLSTIAIPDSLSVSQTTGGLSFRQAIRQPGVLALMVVCCINQLTHMPYYTFFTIYLNDHGYSDSAAGGLWALGVIAEIVLFAAIPLIWKRFNPWMILIIAALATIVRWLLIGWVVDQVAILIVAQILHMFTYGAYHAAAVVLIHRYFTGQSQGRGQALYSAVSFGLGGAIGALLSGPAREMLGDSWMFTGAALFGIVGLVAAVVGYYTYAKPKATAA